MQRTQLRSMMEALLAAMLFGASAPLAKLLLGEVEPISLAAFLYLGSGIGAAIFRTLLRTNKVVEGPEAPIVRADVGWLAGAVLSGGVAAPILLLFSLQHTSAPTASLLLNFEGVATAIIAVLVFKEAVSQRAVWAMLFVTLASIVLSLNTSGKWGLSLGAVGILGACILWGIDNNLTRNISAKNPLTIVLVKGLGAGSVSFVLALLVGNRLPTPSVALGALVLGSLSYGLSIVLFIRAMRGLGAARTSALFGTAPLAGVVLSLGLFRESPPVLFFVGLPLILVAMLLLLNERHGHAHVHDTTSHDHRHRHDDQHHTHTHPGGASSNLEHSHLHVHTPIKHEHPHLPEIHHRHAH